MKQKRRVAREKIIQSLYQLDMNKTEPEEALVSILEDETEEVDVSFVRDAVTGVWEHLSRIDSVLKKHLTGWELERIANVDRAILRLAAYELIYVDEIPNSVSVNEAIELAKAFSTDESSKFVNGVLGKLVAHPEDLRKEAE